MNKQLSLVFALVFVALPGFSLANDSGLVAVKAVSYTHLTLPTNREV